MNFRTKVEVFCKKDYDMNTVRRCVFHHFQWEHCRKDEHASLGYLIYRLVYMLGLWFCHIYSIVSFFNLFWMKKHVFISSCKKRDHIHPESRTRSFELKEANNWGSIDNNEPNGNEVNGPVCINIGNDDIVSYNPSPFQKLEWASMSISHVIPYIVTLGFWIFVYKYDPDQRTCEIIKSHYMVHGATAVLAFIDSMVVATPARITHFVFPSMVLTIYCTYFYELSGGPYRDGNEYIYSFLNWRHDPGTAAAISIGGILISPLAYIVLCWLPHKLKLYLVSRYRK